MSDEAKRLVENARVAAYAFGEQACKDAPHMTDELGEEKRAADEADAALLSYIARLEAEVERLRVLLSIVGACAVTGCDSRGTIDVEMDHRGHLHPVQCQWCDEFRQEFGCWPGERTTTQ